jgi:hypothetical protein
LLGAPVAVTLRPKPAVADETAVGRAVRVALAVALLDAVGDAVAVAVRVADADIIGVRDGIDAVGVPVELAPDERVPPPSTRVPFASR